MEFVILEAPISTGTSKGKSNIGIRVSPSFVCIDIIETITPSVDIAQLIIKVLRIKV